MHTFEILCAVIPFYQAIPSVLDARASHVLCDQVQCSMHTKSITYPVYIITQP